jgi:hypothetical protein
MIINHQILKYREIIINRKIKRHLHLIAFSLVIGLSLNAQSNSYSEVYNTLKKNDSLIFDRAFNNCELQYFDQFITNDFEFYHDIAGITKSKQQFIETIKDGVCKTGSSTKSTRELSEGSLEVFLLKNNGKIYGALQNGIHKFYETTNGHKVAGSTAKFSHLWVLEKGNWVLKRVLSYHHQMK